MKLWALTLSAAMLLAACGPKPAARQGEGALTEGAPLEGALTEGAPLEGAPTDGAPTNRAEVPTVGQQPLESQVTWTIQSLDEPWLEAPYTTAITLPHRFRMRFSGPVDSASVEAAVSRNLGAAYQTDRVFRDDQTLDITLTAGPYSEPWTFISLTPEGGKDRTGAQLPARLEDKLLLSVRSPTVISRWQHGKAVEEVNRLPGGFDLVSASPDGQRFALRRHAFPQVGGFPPVGPPLGMAYWYDGATERLEQVKGASGWLTPRWLPDGALLMAGTMGLTLVTANGEQRPLVEERRVVWVAPDPEGRRVAILLAGPLDAPGALWLVDLIAGDRQEYPDAFTPSYSPNGVPQGVALWSPDGETLVYTEGTERYGEVRLVAFAPASGTRRVLVEMGGRPVSWAPDSTRLYVHNVGVLAMPEGRVELAAYGSGAFSPDGALLFAGERGLLRVPDWEPVREWDRVIRHAAWSPDGAHLALWNGGPNADLYTPDGRAAMRVAIPDSANWDEPPFWSPDGRYVTFGGVQLVDTNLYRLGDLPVDRGRPIGWSQTGFLYIGPGPGWGDGGWWSPGW